MEKHSGQRGAIAIDAKLAVRTIAKSLRVDLTSTLAAVRLADDRLLGITSESQQM